MKLASVVVLLGVCRTLETDPECLVQELDVTRPALPKRRLQSAKQLPSSYSRSSNMTSSTEEPVPANWAAPQRSSAVNDAGALTTVSGSVEPTSTALEPSAAVTVFNDDEYDATLPRAPPRRHRRHSAEQLRRLYAQSPDAISSASIQKDPNPTLTSAPIQTTSLIDTGTSRDDSRHNDVGSADGDRRSRTNRVGRLYRRHRRPGQLSPTDVEGRPSTRYNRDVAQSRRITMPSAVHYTAQNPPSPPVTRNRQLPSGPAPDRPASSVYVLSDGVRRRLVPADSEQLAPPQYPLSLIHI